MARRLTGAKISNELREQPPADGILLAAMPQGADQQTPRSGASLKDQPMSFYPLLIMRVPEQEHGIEGVELRQVGHNIRGEVKMLQFEQEVARNPLGNGTLRDVGSAAQEPVCTESEAVFLSVGKEQDAATVFENADQVIVKARGNHDAFAAPGTVRVQSAAARKKLCGEGWRDRGVQLDVFERIGGWGRDDPDRPFITPLVVFISEVGADDQVQIGRASCR